MSELTTEDITTGTELVYQGPSVDFTNDRDYRKPVRGTVVDIAEETKHLVSDTIEQTMVIIETEDGEEKRVDIENFVGETEFRVGIIHAPSEDDQDDDEQEIVTDGGEDVTDHVDDETIEAAMKDHLNVLGHDEDPDVEDIRDAVAWVQQGMAEAWSDWLTSVEHNEAQIVFEDSETVVFATGEDNVPRRDLRDYYDGELHEMTPEIVSLVHHKLARDICDYDWSYTYPLVIRKPESFDAGQQYVESIISGLQKSGLSPAEAWAYYGVEIRGNSQSSWARRAGKDQSTINRSLKRAKKKLPR